MSSLEMGWDSPWRSSKWQRGRLLLDSELNEPVQMSWEGAGDSVRLTPRAGELQLIVTHSY